MTSRERLLNLIAIGIQASAKAAGIRVPDRTQAWQQAERELWTYHNPIEDREP